MSDLISRQAAINAVKEEEYPCESDYDEGYMAALDKAVWIMEKWLPSVQPEQTCENCRYGSAEWDDELCDSCTGANNHWKPSVQPEQQWIPCNERMPKVGQTVICQCRADILKLLKLDSGGDWYQDAEHAYMSGFVIAWMPLPEPYKGGQP